MSNRQWCAKRHSSRIYHKSLIVVFNESVAITFGWIKALLCAFQIVTTPEFRKEKIVYLYFLKFLFEWFVGKRFWLYSNCSTEDSSWFDWKLILDTRIIQQHCSIIINNTAQYSTTLLNIQQHCSKFNNTAQYSTTLLNIQQHCSMFNNSTTSVNSSYLLGHSPQNLGDSPRFPQNPPRKTPKTHTN